MADKLDLISKETKMASNFAPIINAILKISAQCKILKQYYANAKNYLFGQSAKTGLNSKPTQTKKADPTKPQSS